MQVCIESRINRTKDAPTIGHKLRAPLLRKYNYIDDSTVPTKKMGHVGCVSIETSLFSFGYRRDTVTVEYHLDNSRLYK